MAINEYLQKYTIQESATLLDAIKVIGNNSARAVVVLFGNKPIGMLSEGDIMRALMLGTDIHAHIKPVMQLSFKYLTSKDIDSAFNIFRQHLITLLPIVDVNMELVDVITLRDILETAVIQN